MWPDPVFNKKKKKDEEREGTLWSLWENAPAGMLLFSGQLTTQNAQNYEGSLLIVCVPFLLSSVCPEQLTGKLSVTWPSANVTLGVVSYPGPNRNQRCDKEQWKINLPHTWAKSQGAWGQPHLTHELGGFPATPEGCIWTWVMPDVQQTLDRWPESNSI